MYFPHELLMSSLKNDTRTRSFERGYRLQNFLWVHAPGTLSQFITSKPPLICQDENINSFLQAYDYQTMLSQKAVTAGAVKAAQREGAICAEPQLKMAQKRITLKYTYRYNCQQTSRMRDFAISGS